VHRRNDAWCRARRAMGKRKDSVKNRPWCETSIPREPGAQSWFPKRHQKPITPTFSSPGKQFRERTSLRAVDILVSLLNSCIYQQHMDQESVHCLDSARADLIGSESFEFCEKAQQIRTTKMAFLALQSADQSALSTRDGSVHATQVSNSRHALKLALQNFASLFLALFATQQHQFLSFAS
jgi:hypothetical protein